MPENIELNTDNIDDSENFKSFGNDCEKVKLTADEYLHDELPDQDKDFIENHISECKECLEYIETERKYLAEVRLAEYIPEISISQSVMDKIIDKVMIVDKPPKRRFMPVGLISAAVIVIMIALLSKGGPLNIFMEQFDNKNIENNAAGIAESERFYGGDSIISALDGGMKDSSLGDGAGDYDNDAVNGFGVFSADDDAPALMQSETGSFALTEPASVEDNLLFAAGEADKPDEEAIAEVPQPTGEYGLPKNMTNSDFLASNSNLNIEIIYRVYYFPAESETVLKIYNGIESYNLDYYDNNYRIIEIKYKETLEKNLLDNNIIYEVSYLDNPDADGPEYIGVIHFID